jgi:hypothetical protein
MSSSLVEKMRAKKALAAKAALNETSEITQGGEVETQTVIAETTAIDIIKHQQVPAEIHSTVIFIDLDQIIIEAAS